MFLYLAAFGAPYFLRIDQPPMVMADACWRVAFKGLKGMIMSKLRAFAVLVFIVVFANASYAEQADDDVIKDKGADEECDYTSRGRLL